MECEVVCLFDLVIFIFCCVAFFWEVFLMLKDVTRRQLVVQLISERGALATKQVAAAVFGESRYGLWKAQTELKKLYDAKILRRGRCDVAGDYVYWEEKPNDLNHLVLCNWVWVRLNQLGGLSHFENEKPLDGIQPDAYFIFNGKPFFLELHRHINKRFDKVSLYEKYFSSGVWATPEWPGGNRFAAILVVTDNKQARKYCENKIAKENKIGLRFRVRTLAEFWERPWEVLE